MVRGFYDGGGKYFIRFMPPREGAWRYTTISNRPPLDGKQSEVKVAKNSGTNRGTVRVSAVSQFAFAGGTPYHPIGTTIYAFPHQPEALQRQTLAKLAKAPFNKLRFCVFPKWYSFNKIEPLIAPYETRPDGKFDQWNMTIAPLGRYTKTDRPDLALPSRMFLAVRATPQ